MKKLLFFFLLTPVIICNLSFAQTPTLQQKLYYTCKIWGYTKYFHYDVSMCNVNWDSVLLHVLPMVKAAPDYDAFNDAIDTMLTAAGPITFATSYFPDTLAPDLKRNLNFGWMTDPILRADNQAFLLTVKDNFRPHAGCRVYRDTVGGSGWLSFPSDDPMLNVNTYTDYPDEYQRLLLLFAHWNIINYFDPYTYVFNKPMDTILFNNIVQIDTVSNAKTLCLAIRKITSGFDDIHVEDLTLSGYYPFTGYYVPELMLQYIQGEYIVVKSGVAAIPVGDAIISVNGLTASQWEDSLSDYISAGNGAGFHRDMCKYLLAGDEYSTENVVYADTSGATGSITLSRNVATNDAFFPEYYYPADSLDTISWTTIGCDLGYMNIGNLTLAGADTAYSALRNAPAIIVDIRNYPISRSAWELANLMYTGPRMFAILTEPDLTYPGTFKMFFDSLGVSENATPYLGTIILLFNQETQSAAEFDCMAFGAMPKVIKIGSQTAGTDGNITNLSLTQDIQSGFTTLGVYYPNGDSTERIGIVPDSIVTPTIAGIMQGWDEVLDKALQIGCAIASAVPTINTNKAAVSVFPNPAQSQLTISSTNQHINQVTITNLLGQTIYSKPHNSPQVQIDVSSLPTGLYIVKVNGSEVRKFVKE